MRACPQAQKFEKAAAAYSMKNYIRTKSEAIAAPVLEAVRVGKLGAVRRSGAAGAGIYPGSSPNRAGRPPTGECR